LTLHFPGTNNSNESIHSLDLGSSENQYSLAGSINAGDLMIVRLPAGKLPLIQFGDTITLYDDKDMEVGQLLGQMLQTISPNMGHPNPS
jgi:hypothetical protein